MSNKKYNSSEIGVQVVIEDLSDHPFCPHGPALLFSQANKKFYACSACRNRKDCGFYMLEDDWKRKKNKKNIQESKRTQYVFSIADNYDEMSSLPDNERSYCHTCGALFKTTEESKLHTEHDVQNELSSHLFKNPSELLKPLNNNQTEAQYFFSKSTVAAIIKVLKKNNLRNVICLGTPRVHEYIQNKCLKKGMKSILLDIDSRRYAFHRPQEFCHYNIFNNHFFNAEEGRNVFNKFITSDCGGNMCVIMDPPFGGRIEPLGQTLKSITKLHKSLNKTQAEENLLPTLLVYPYFMEPQISNHISDLKMCDYQVEYDNHSLFKEKKTSKHGSPVRLFTNIPLENFVLPSKEGYSYCDVCSKYVGKWNNHCPKCDMCVSKNGSTYVHCDTCDRCVKQSWEHCYRCNRCCLREHPCGISLPNKSCFNCNKFGHKKNDCPLLQNNILKRPRDVQIISSTKKLKLGNKNARN